MFSLVAWLFCFLCQTGNTKMSKAFYLTKNTKCGAFERFGTSLAILQWVYKSTSDNCRDTHDFQLGFTLHLRCCSPENIYKKALTPIDSLSIYYWNRLDKLV